MDDLEARFGKGERVAFVEHLGGLVATLSFAGARASVAVKGAQVLTYEPAGQEDVLWIATGARLDAQRAPRGGIPVCWPWFGPHPSIPQRPAHGFVRLRPWQVVATNAHEEGTGITLAFAARDCGAEDALDARAEIEVTLRSDRLDVALTTINTGVGALTFSEALHTYLRVSDIAAVRVLGLSERRYIDKLANDAIGVGERAIEVSGEIDRIYQDTRDAVDVDDGRRRIRVSKSGSLSTVIWNPWIDKSRRLGDMSEGEYRRMICVETANAGKNLVTLAPGERHRMIASLALVSTGGKP